MSPAVTAAGLTLREADARATAAVVLGLPGIRGHPAAAGPAANGSPDPSSDGRGHQDPAESAARAVHRTVVLTAAQLDSVDRAARAIESRGGVLLADRTGTGKTFLALALIERALSAGSRRILVTGPAALGAQWTPLLRKAAHAHGAGLLACRGRTKVSTMAHASGPWSPVEQPADRPLVAWLSHAMLSLGRWPPAVDACDLIVVDEAHAFRNPSTRRHQSLAWLCRSSNVVLLTATPINNSLMDLYFLFRLFVGDGALDDLGVPDLEAAFRWAADAGGPVRPPLDAAIDALTVRTRSRRLSSMQSASLRTPAPDDAHASDEKPADPARSLSRESHGDRLSDRPGVRPVAVRYDSEADGREIAGIVDGIRRLDLSAYAVSPAGRHPAVGELVRFGLVKRLESSVAALSASARALRGYLASFADAAVAGFWLSPSSHRAFTANHAGQLLLAPLALPRLPPGFDPARLAAAAMADAAILRELVDLASADNEPDHKARVLAGLLDGDLADRKVLVFTEFRDTAVHLWKVLRTHARVGLIHGSKAVLGDAPAGRLEVVRRFAPLANGAAPDSRERVDVLIATDVLAEGFNLQDAADVVSYDLPWNPVRLIQRIGRIDRAGSPHRFVRCYNFLPDRTLDLYLGLVDRIRAKLETIRTGPGRTGLHGPFAGIAASAISGHARSRPLRRSQTPGAHFRRPRVEAGQPARPHIDGVWPQRHIENGHPLGQVEGLHLRRPRVPTAVGIRSTSLLRRLGDEDPGLFDEFEDAADPIAGLGTPDAPASAPDPGGSDDRWIVALSAGWRTPRLILVRSESGSPAARNDHLRAIRLLDAIRSGHLDARVWVRAPRADPVALRSERESQAAAAAVAALDGPATGTTGPTPSINRRAILIRRLLRLVAREPGRPDPRLIERVDRLVSAMHTGLRVGVEVAVASSMAAAAERRWRPGRTARLVSELESLIVARPTQREPGEQPDAGQPLIAVFELAHTNDCEVR